MERPAPPSQDHRAPGRPPVWAEPVKVAIVSYILCDICNSNLDHLRKRRFSPSSLWITLDADDGGEKRFLLWIEPLLNLWPRECFLLALVCAASSSYQWYSWGPPNMQCRLCASCWTYWKKYGGLKMPTRLDGERPGPNRSTMVRAYFKYSWSDALLLSCL